MTNVISPSASTNTATTPSAAGTMSNIQSRSRRNNWSAADKSVCLELFHSSGKTQSEFAKEMNVPPATLSLWLRQERGGTAVDAGNEEDGALVEVPLPAPSSPASVLATFHFPGGIKLEVPVGADVSWIGQVLGELRPC